MRQDWEQLAELSAAQIRHFQDRVRILAEQGPGTYEDIVDVEARKLLQAMEVAEKRAGLPPGFSIALALLRVGVRV